MQFSVKVWLQFLKILSYQYFMLVLTIFLYPLQWQSCTKSMAYLFYRWFMALFFVVVVIISMWPEADDASSYWLYFIYMTNWGIWMCMLTNALGAILVTIWHYHPEYAGEYDMAIYYKNKTVC